MRPASSVRGPLSPRHALGAATVAGLMIAGVVLGADLAQAQDEPEPGEPGVARVEGVGSGQPRDVAIELCQLQHDDGAVDRLALARDDEFADALAGSALPGVGCILFTPGGPGEPLHPDVRAEIDRVTGGLADIYLLGGDQAVSSQVEQELDQAGYGIARLEGTTRFETAEAIAQAAARAVATPREEVIVANGLEWVDAITSGAYAAREVAPVVLTTRDQLHPAAERVLDGLDPQRTWVVGGTAVVSHQAADATPNPQRAAGNNRMSTAVAVAEQMWPGVDGFAGDTYVTANLERGDGWVPALAATRLSAAWNAPQLGVWTDLYPDETSDYLQQQDFSDLPSVTLLGDVGFVSDDIAQQIHDDIQPE